MDTTKVGILFMILAVRFAQVYSLTEVTLFTAPRTWNEAKRYCNSINQTLVTIDSQETQRYIQYFLNHYPWNTVQRSSNTASSQDKCAWSALLHTGEWDGPKTLDLRRCKSCKRSHEIWIGLNSPDKTTYEQFLWENSCLVPSYTNWASQEPRISDKRYCVYGVWKRKMFQWKTHNCYKSLKAFMCQKEADECSFEFVDDKRTLTRPHDNETANCKSRCLTFSSTEGQRCLGFDFDMVKNRCDLLIGSDTKSLDKKKSSSPTRRLFIKRCSIKPYLNTDNIGVDERGLCSMLPVGHCNGNNGLCTSQEPQEEDPNGRVHTTTVDVEEKKTTEIHSAAGICTCNCQENEEKDALDAKINKLVNDLRIAKKNTTSARRQLISAGDTRITSQWIGYASIAVLLFLFGGILSMDFYTLLFSLNSYFRKTTDPQVKVKITNFPNRNLTI